MAETILVVGATGGLGSALLRKLASEGYTTKALVRDPVRLDEVAPGAASNISMGDALESGIIADAARNCTTIINCVDFPFEESEKHLSLASHLIEGAQHAGARLFYPTPAWSVGSDQDGWTRPESDAPPAHRVGVLRNRAERLLRESAENHRVDLTFFRMAMLYGPHCPNSFLTPLFNRALTGKHLDWPASRSEHHDLLYVENAASALYSAIGTDRLQEAYCVGSGVPITGKKFCETLAALTGSRSATRRLGKWLGGLRSAKSRGGSITDFVGSVFQQACLLDDALIRQELGYRPMVDLHEGLRRSLRWADHASQAD